MAARVLSHYDHDHAVRIYALKLLSEGYVVRARVEGWFDVPEIVNGYRPDIEAKRNEETVIVEIKKGEVDWPKISALKRFAADQKNYYVRIITPEEAVVIG